VSTPSPSAERCDFCFPSHGLITGEVITISAEEVAHYSRAYAAMCADALTVVLHLEGEEITALRAMGLVAAGINQVTGEVRRTITDWLVCPAGAARWAAYRELYRPQD